MERCRRLAGAAEGGVVTKIVENGPEVFGAGGFAEGELGDAGISHGKVGKAAVRDLAGVVVPIFGDVFDVGAVGFEEIDSESGRAGRFFAEDDGAGG